MDKKDVNDFVQRRVAEIAATNNMNGNHTSIDKDQEQTKAIEIILKALPPNMTLDDKIIVLTGATSLLTARMQMSVMTTSWQSILNKSR